MYENMSTRTTMIGDAEWSLNPFPATKGAGILKRLAKLFGQSFSAILESSDEESEGQIGVAKAIGLLSDNLDKDDVVDLIKVMLSSVRKNGQPIHFDNEFGGRYDVMFKVVLWVAQENFGSFFPDQGIRSL